MVIKEYENKGLLLNVAFVESAGEADTLGFRGRLALVEAEVGDASGNRKTPPFVMEQTTLLSKGDKLKLLSGSLDRLADLPKLVEMYQANIDADTLAIIFVVNATATMQVEMGGTTFSLIPMREGVSWNELMDFALLDKSDMKKMSSGEKVSKVYAELLANYKPKGEKMDFETALTNTGDITREERGAL